MWIKRRRHRLAKSSFDPFQSFITVCQKSSSYASLVNEFKHPMTLYKMGVKVQALQNTFKAIFQFQLFYIKMQACQLPIPPISAHIAVVFLINQIYNRGVDIRSDGEYGCVLLLEADCRFYSSAITSSKTFRNIFEGIHQHRHIP